MKARNFALCGVAVAALLGWSAVAQVTLPQVSAINPATDLIQVIPGGQPAAQSVYATANLVRGALASNGLPGTRIPLIGFKNLDGTTLSASASSGKFGIAITLATSEDLIGEAANSNTKTDTALFEVALPSTYVAGSAVTVNINTQYTLGSGTIGTHTIQVFCYPNTDAGVQAADISTGSTASVPAAAATQTFALTSTNLVPNERLTCKAVMAIQDTGGSNITGQINSVWLS